LERPFFAFHNYYDAHAPYVLPHGASCRFGLKPWSPAEFIFLTEYWETIDKLKVCPVYRALARDCYDSYLSYLDECLGELLNELRQRGILDRTLLIVTADHGEGLGEHDLFDHGESLYRQEIRVPLLLLMVLPRDCSATAVAHETVSLRDLAATIVDLAGQAPSHRSRAGLWLHSAPAADLGVTGGAISELPSPNPYDPNHGRSPAYRGPLKGLTKGDLANIVNQGDGAEELFNERNDPEQARNLAQMAAMQPVLERFRRSLLGTKEEGKMLQGDVAARGSAPPN
jgi:arylsulfatase A-like enzyme